LDDKIEINRRMNETLEAMAQALFKSWFVDFDPVIDNALAAGNPIPEEFAERAELRKKVLEENGNAALKTHHSKFPSSFTMTEELGWIPEGWEMSSVGDEVECVGGGTPSTKNESFWGGTHSFCTPKDMSKLTSIVLSGTTRCLTDDGVQKVNSGILPVGTVLMSSRAPIGYLAIADMPVTVNQGVIAMLKNETYSPIFLLLWTKENMERVVERANGSTFLEISKKNFRPISFLKPNVEVLSVFDLKAEPLLEKIINCGRERDLLTKLRDTLLPKLISGELRVPER